VTLNDIIRSLSRFRRLANAVALLTLAVGVFLAVTPPDRYKATSTVLVQPQLTEDGQPVSVQVIDFLVPSLLRTVDTRGFQATAGEELSVAVRATDVDVSATSESGTGIVTITVTSTDADVVAPWAQAIAEHLVEQPDDELVELTIVEDAVAPEAPYAPNRLLIVVIAMVLAVVNAILAAVIASAVRGRGDRVTELRDRFGALVLGEIPRLRTSTADLAPAEMIDGGHPALADALQTLRANVTIALGERPHPWLVVTSAVPGEGKSMISTSLAWMFASVQRPTILVDGDSRRPSAYRRLRLAVGSGLEALGSNKLASVLQATDSAWLRFLGSGHPDRHPAEIASTNLPHLLREAGESGDTVIIDAPPLPAAAETIVYASACQSVVIVIDARRRDLTNVERMITTLQDRDVHILGVVINRSRRRMPSGYYAKAKPGAVAARESAAVDADVIDIDAETLSPVPSSRRDG
jgi:capsular exopolysaccharide synthesis family protein